MILLSILWSSCDYLSILCWNFSVLQFSYFFLILVILFFSPVNIIKTPNCFICVQLSSSFFLHFCVLSPIFSSGHFWYKANSRIHFYFVVNCRICENKICHLPLSSFIFTCLYLESNDYSMCLLSPSFLLCRILPFIIRFRSRCHY